MPVKPVAVILDLGNVVLNWNIEGILNSLDMEIEVRDRLRDELFLHQDWLDLDHGITTEAEVLDAICARSPLTPTQVETTLIATKHSMQPLPKTLELMQEIKAAGLPMYCLSNMSRESYAHIQRHDFFDLFAGIVISGHERCMKPDATIFDLILQRFDLDPETSLFVDDSLPNIDAAQALGIQAFHFKRSPACYQTLRARLF